MSNPFSGIITQSLKDLHKNMIDALLEDSACTVLCTIHYESKKSACLNCLKDNMTGKSKNIYLTGGPIPFSHGVCPFCAGLGIITEPSTENIYLMTIWDSKGWFNHTEDVDVQTMSKITSMIKLTKASHITLDATIKGWGISDFVRVGQPEPLGFGANPFILTNWKRA